MLMLPYAKCIYNQSLCILNKRSKFCLAQHLVLTDASTDSSYGQSSDVTVLEWQRRSSDYWQNIITQARNRCYQQIKFSTKQANHSLSSISGNKA